jgi:hypothetical protein
MVGFAKQKKEVVVLRNLASNEINENDQAQFEDNTLANKSKKKRQFTMRSKKQLFVLLKRFSQTKPFSIRRKKQIDVLKLLYSYYYYWFISTRQKFVAGVKV